jgi:nucleoside-diphosphate-sugar epimerase
MRLFLTGGTGFLGSHVVERAVARGWEVACLARTSSDTGFLKTQPVKLVEGDVSGALSPEARAALGAAEAVVHAAGLIQARNLDEFLRVNAGGTESLAAAHRDAGGRGRFVLVSSISAAGAGRREDEPGAPVSDYGKSKLAGEEKARASGLPWVVLRPGIIYGPRDHATLKYMKVVKRGFRPNLGSRQHAFTHGRDVADAVVAACEREAAVGQVFHVNSGVEHHWDDFGRAVAHALGRRSLPLPIPDAGIWFAAFFAEAWARARRRPTITGLDKARDATAKVGSADNRKARERLSWTPRFDLEGGVKETVDWYLAHGWL